MAETPLDEPIHLLDALSYQKQGIVSRVLLKKPTGTITLFAFDQGEELSEHTAPFDALVQVLEGTGEIHIDKHPYQLSAQEALLLPAHVPHAVRALTPFKMVLTMLRSSE